MSQSLPFERVKHIHIKYKHIVSGYIRATRIFEIPESIKLVILLFYYKTIESTILTDDECYKLLSLFDENKVFKHLGNHSYKLLFRGTRDGFTTKNFYEKCFNKKNSVCIVHTPQNNVFGGYTSLAWWRPSDVKYQTDRFAFIYTIRSNKTSNPEIFAVKDEGRNAIQLFENYYLSFGTGGQGFYFCQYGNNEVLGYASRGRCKEYHLDELALNGEDTHFQPLEIEVFQLEIE